MIGNNLSGQAINSQSAESEKKNIYLKKMGLLLTPFFLFENNF